MPGPQDLLDLIGQTHKFIVKVSDHNLTGKTQSITVTKILPSEAPHPTTHSEGFAGDRVRKASERLESSEAKRSKSG